jgi:hypothetical protein
MSRPTGLVEVKLNISTDLVTTGYNAHTPISFVFRYFGPPAILTEVFRDIPWCLQTNVWIVPSSVQILFNSVSYIKLPSDGTGLDTYELTSVMLRSIHSRMFPAFRDGG